MKLQFKKLLQNDGWLENAVVETDEKGLIISIEKNIKAAEFIDGYAIPGFQNAHSHSFQYAMAGLAENHSPNKNRSDFWSWREQMYRLALGVNPEQFERIAAMLYHELLRHGYTNVAEFHYLHHDKDGKSYANLAEMGERLVSAAQKTGINITLIPIFYQKGGFLNKTPEPNQKRFVSKTIEDYRKLYEATEKVCKNYENANVGIGIHSLRAVKTEAIKEVAANFPKDVPFHIHISEQLKEVQDCVEFLGTRPVKWMLDNVELSDRFHFVHATHLDETEIKDLAEMGANVVLCPTTEGNLGDGIFPLREFQNAGGNWSIGTDSHISLNPFEELRLLDYGQRLVSHKRDTFSDDKCGNSAIYVIHKTTIAGRKAMNNFERKYFAVGEPFNACIVSAEHPLISTASPENLLNTIVYASDETMQKGAVVNGKRKMENGEFIRNEIFSDFVKTINELKNR